MVDDPNDNEQPIPTFTVTSQIREPNPNDRTGASDIWKIEYTTSKGTVSWVIVSQQHYTTKKVAEAIIKDYKEVSGVDNLQGEIMSDAHRSY